MLLKNISLTALLITSLSYLSCKEGEPKKDKMIYPASKKIEHTDEYFGVKVADPYRWLEDDRSAETGAWVDAQIAFTNAYLSKIPFTEQLKTRLTELWNFEKIGSPFKKGDYFYLYRNDGLQNQAVLYRSKSLDGEQEVFINPNDWSKDGTVALGEIDFSKDKKLAAYQISESGSDWQTIYVMNVETKEKLKDEVKWVKFSGIAWQGNGFYYSRYDEPKKGDELKGASEFQKIYFHKIGTPQSEDKLIYEDKANPKFGFGASTSEDEKLLVITPWEGTSGNKLIFLDLSKPNAKPITVVDNFENDYNFVHKEGNLAYFLTNNDAPNQRLIAIDIEKPAKENWKVLIAESNFTLQGVSVGGGKFFANYLEHAITKIKQFDLSGKLEKEVKLPDLGTANGFDGEKSDSTLFYTFTSFTRPTSIYTYSIATGESKLWKAPQVPFNPEDFQTEQVFVTSKDGTKLPMFIVSKKGMQKNGQNPAYLYSYGGFNVNMVPTFSVKNILWMELGGIYAQPCLRGGGEYGAKWHEAGTKMQKKNVFEDFIAAAEYLEKEKYSNKNLLAIEGGSNGGLLVGATMTMRPDICKVAFPAVGVLDMLRFQHFTIGRAWSSDYGNSEESKEMFAYLRSYSPLHNVKEIAYPATMIATADHDDRVVPAHSFKFAAELQAKQQGEAPILIRIDKNAGHGAGKPTAMRITEWAERFAFTFNEMGINPYEKK